MSRVTVPLCSRQRLRDRLPDFVVCSTHCVQVADVMPSSASPMVIMGVFFILPAVGFIATGSLYHGVRACAAMNKAALDAYMGRSCPGLSCVRVGGRFRAVVARR